MSDNNNMILFKRIIWIEVLFDKKLWVIYQNIKFFLSLVVFGHHLIFDNYGLILQFVVMIVRTLKVHHKLGHKIHLLVLTGINVWLAIYAEQNHLRSISFVSLLVWFGVCIRPVILFRWPIGWIGLDIFSFSKGVSL